MFLNRPCESFNALMRVCVCYVMLLSDVCTCESVCACRLLICTYMLVIVDVYTCYRCALVFVCVYVRVTSWFADPRLPIA